MKRYPLITGLVAVGCVVAVCVAMGVLPTYARVQENHTWSGRVAQAADTATDQAAGLLVTGGQSVLLGVVDGEMEIPLGLSTEGTWTVEISDPQWVEADVQMDDEAVLVLRSPLQQESEETDDSDLTEPTQDMDSDDSADPGDENADEADAEPTTADLAEDEDGQPEEITSQQALWRPDEVTVTVRCANGGDTQEATFVLSSAAASTPQGVIALDEAVTYYHPAVLLRFSTGDEPVTLLCNRGNFPAMTRYRVGDTLYLLYAAGALQLPAQVTVELDLSLTGLTGSLSLTDGAQSRTLAYCALTDWAAQTTPLISHGETLTVAVPYAWGAASPFVTVERLEKQETELVWVQEDAVLAASGENDYLCLTPQQAPAGTYRVTLSWQQEGSEIGRTVVPFYLFYHEDAGS